MVVFPSAMGKKKKICVDTSAENQVAWLLLWQFSAEI